MFELVLANLNHTLWGVQFHANMVVDPVEQFGRASREGTELSICVNLFQTLPDTGIRRLVEANIGKVLRRLEGFSLQEDLGLESA